MNIKIILNLKNDILNSKKIHTKKIKFFKFHDAKKKLQLAKIDIKN